MLRRKDKTAKCKAAGVPASQADSIMVQRLVSHWLRTCSQEEIGELVRIAYPLPFKRRAPATSGDAPSEGAPLPPPPGSPPASDVEASGATKDNDRGQDC